MRSGHTSTEAPRTARVSSALALAAAAFVCPGCATADREPAEEPEEPVASAPAEGGPHRSPPDGVPVEPVSPPGIESISVEAEVVEGEVRGDSPAPSGGPSLPPSEVPVPRDGAPGRPGQAGPDASAADAAPVRVRTGTDAARRPAGGGVRVVPQQGLLLEGADGTNRTAGIPELLGLPTTARLRDLTVAHDPFADRFLLAGVAGEGGSAGTRVVLGVSRKAEPWAVTGLSMESAGLEGALLELALDEENVYLLFGGSAVSIAKGAESGGLYAGGTARVEVTRRR